MGIARIIDTFVNDIECGDFNVAALVGGELSCDWAYSIGLHRSFEHPELIIVGLDASFTGAVLEKLGREVAGGRVISQGEELEVFDGFAMRVQMVEQPWLSMGEWFVLGQAVMSHWGLRWPDTLQLLWADEKGRFPDVPGDPYWMLRQPLLCAQPCNA